MSLRKKVALDELEFTGHPNVLATHKTTLEITTEDYLTPRGDCIIGINASKSLADLNERVKSDIRLGYYVYLVIQVGNYSQVIIGKGSPSLSLDDKVRMIIRKSTYTSSSTLMIMANSSARNIDRRIVETLRRGNVGKAFILTSEYPLKDVEALRELVNGLSVDNIS
ncbi:DUF371 domain-containing protein [Candidatus Acidianus copahuensis]|uniref:DUF371 domain-containing protein n=1 Tax=Candidatus Acidianus copahuensis TaxID=1160895 RepID=UPI001F23EB66|nr:DUF371 domain-containing protein [Candidatus Acidianus copahuensis]